MWQTPAEQRSNETCQAEKSVFSRADISKREALEQVGLIQGSPIISRQSVAPFSKELSNNR